MKVMRLLAICCCLMHALANLGCFYDIASQLKSYDRLLCGRLYKKKNLLKNGVSRLEFINQMKIGKSNGTEYLAEYTRDWLTEIIQGLDDNYKELLDVNTKHGRGGYEDYTGFNLFSVFNKYLGNKSQIFYKMQIVNPLRHYWLIEQLSNNQGYRIYQSYDNAYSLNAWLTAHNSTFDTLWHSQDIIYWQSLYDEADAFLRQIPGGSMQNIRDLPSSLAWMKPWLYFIKDYRKEKIIKNLKKSWSMFGGGNIISKIGFYENYLTPLANLTESIKRIVGTQNIWSESMDAQWIQLFGAPNPLCFPNIEFIGRTKGLRNDFKLEIKVLQFTSQQNQITDGKILAESVGSSHKLCLASTRSLQSITILYTSSLLVILITELCA